MADPGQGEHQVGILGGGLFGVHADQDDLTAPLAQGAQRVLPPANTAAHGADQDAQIPLSQDLGVVAHDDPVVGDLVEDAQPPQPVRKLLGGLKGAVKPPDGDVPRGADALCGAAQVIGVYTVRDAAQVAHIGLDGVVHWVGGGGAFAAFFAALGPLGQQIPVHRIFEFGIALVAQLLAQPHQRRVGGTGRLGNVGYAQPVQHAARMGQNIVGQPLLGLGQGVVVPL